MTERDVKDIEEIKSFAEDFKHFVENDIKDGLIEEPKLHPAEEEIKAAETKPAEKYQGVWEFEKAIANAKLNYMKRQSKHKRRDYEDWMIERGYLTEEERFLGRFLED